MVRAISEGMEENMDILKFSTNDNFAFEGAKVIAHNLKIKK